MQRGFFKRPKFIPTYLSPCLDTVRDKGCTVHRGRERGAAVTGMGGGGARAGAGRIGTCEP